MLASRLVLGGRYELAERVGAGGFSEVWRATDLVLARPVAVKLPYPGFTQDDEALARFRAEARNAGRLSHENVARVYDYGEPDPPNPPFLVLELIDGPPLSVLLRDGPLAPGRVARLLAQAATGLAAAHQAGLIHRDIKPGNLLIAPGGTVKITDFGISYAAGSAPLTGTGLVYGTPAYLAPERATGASATAAGDLYSLGIVGYQCLTGELPFTGNPLQLALAHRELPLPPLPGSVPAGLAALILALTAKDPAARPGSAAEVARHATALAGQLGSAGLPARGRRCLPGAARACPAVRPDGAARACGAPRGGAAPGCRAIRRPADPASAAARPGGAAPPVLGTGRGAGHGGPRRRDLPGQPGRPDADAARGGRAVGHTPAVRSPGAARRRAPRRADRPAGHRGGPVAPAARPEGPGALAAQRRGAARHRAGRAARRPPPGGQRDHSDRRGSAAAVPGSRRPWPWPWSWPWSWSWPWPRSRSWARRRRGRRPGERGRRRQPGVRTAGLRTVAARRNDCGRQG